MNIQELRSAGFKVRVCHLRRVLTNEVYKNRFRTIEHYCSRSEIEEMNARGMKFIVHPCGGFTRIEVTTPEGQLYVGTTRTSNEQFNRKMAIEAALGRALKKMHANTSVNVVGG